jgi:hypothetical protein
VPDLHAAHDLGEVVAFVDGELTGPEAELIEARLATCPDCAGIATDVRALATATRAIQAPSRTRDFRLTPADVARLVPDAAAVAAHATHDPECVSAYMDGALDAADAPLVASWLSACHQCASLRDDLAAIAEAHRAMSVPARSTDYRLSDSDAARLSRRGWRGWVALIGTSRDLVTRPLALGLTAIGIAGLLVTAGPLLPIGSAARTLSAVGAAVSGNEAQSANGSNSGKSGPSRVVIGAPGVDSYGLASAAPSIAVPAAAAAPSTAPASGGAAAFPSAASSAAAPSGEAAAPAPLAPALGASSAPRSAADIPSDAPAVDAAGGSATDAGITSDIAAFPTLLIGSIVALGAGLGLIVLRRRAASISAI